VAARRGIPFFAAGVIREIESNAKRTVGMLGCLEIEFHAGRPRRAAPTVRSLNDLETDLVRIDHWTITTRESPLNREFVLPRG
jgi:hypothetical protein